MTSAAPQVEPATIAAINDARPPCECRDGDLQRCTDPAAWVVTFVYRPTGDPIIVLHCVEHYAVMQEHRARCLVCPAVFDVTAVEL